MSRSCGLLFCLTIVAAMFSVGCDTNLDAEPPGPIIDVRPDPVNSGKIEWTTREDEASPPFVQVPDGGPIYPGCKLRSDFIGKKAILFDFCLSGEYPSCASDLANPKRVRFVNSVTKVTIEVTRDPDDHERISWAYSRKTDEGFEFCALTSETPDPGHLPNEFEGLTLLTEVTPPAPAKTGEDFQMRVAKY